MKQLQIIVIISALTLLTVPAMARETAVKTGSYVSLFIGVSIPKDGIVTTDDFTGSRSYSYQDNVTLDPGVNVGGAAGYDFGVMRLEGELSYRISEVKSIVDQANGNQFHNTSGNLEITAFMVNSFIDMHNQSNVTPYLGGGVGLAVVHQGDTFGTSSRSGSLTRSRLYDAGDDTVFAYQAGAGVDVALSRRYSIDIGYRYFGTATATLNRDSVWVNSLKFESHNATVGFRARF